MLSRCHNTIPALAQRRIQFSRGAFEIGDVLLRVAQLSSRAAAEQAVRQVQLRPPLSMDNPLHTLSHYGPLALYLCMRVFVGDGGDPYFRRHVQLLAMQAFCLLCRRFPGVLHAHYLRPAGMPSFEFFKSRVLGVTAPWGDPSP